MGTNWRKGHFATLDNPGTAKSMLWINQHKDYGEDWCLIYPFALCQNGYGSISIGPERKSIYVHRFMCEYRNGPAPSPKHHAAHSCGRGAEGCVNPRHLSWKTNAENQLEREPRHRRNKLTAAQADEIRGLKDLEAANITAARFNITETNVRQIQSGKIWGPEKQRLRVFTPEEVQNIRSHTERGQQQKLAKEYGVSSSTIRRIQTRGSYRDLP